MGNAECVPFFFPEMENASLWSWALRMGREGGRQNWKIFLGGRGGGGVSPPKRPFSFWDHDTVKNILWQMVAGYSSISATHDKTILHGGVWLLCFLFLPVLCIVNSISVPVVASEYHTCTMPWRASPCSDLSGLYFLSAALLFRRLTPPPLRPPSSWLSEMWLLL